MGVRRTVETTCNGCRKTLAGDDVPTDWWAIDARTERGKRCGWLPDQVLLCPDCAAKQFEAWNATAPLAHVQRCAHEASRPVKIPGIDSGREFRYCPDCSLTYELALVRVPKR